MSNIFATFAAAKPVKSRSELSHALISLFRNRVQRYDKKMKNTNYSVKKYQSYWVLFFALLLCGPMNAKVTNYIGATAQVGEWTLMPSGSTYSPSLGVTGGLGFQYELQAGRAYRPTRFLFDIGVGASGGMTSYRQSSNQTVTLYNQFDTEGDQFDYVYNVNNRRDRYNDVAVQVPLMVGMQHKRFYFLAGVKVYAHIWTKTKSTASIETYGSYVYGDGEGGATYIGSTGQSDLRNVPDQQFFTNVQKSGGVKTNFNLDLDLSMEIGARLGTILYDVGYDVPKRKIEYRLAAFVDYGLLDLHTKGNQQALITPTTYENNPDKGPRSMVDNLVMNDVMSTSGFASKVNNLVVGLKFTILFQMPEEGKCVICSDSYTSSVRNYGRSRRGMQYEE